MRFAKVTTALGALFATIASASPTPRTTCPGGSVWGANVPALQTQWDLVGYERHITNPNEPAFDTSYELSAICPSGGSGSITWWVESASTCGHVTGLTINQISISVTGGPPDYPSFSAYGNGSAVLTVQCPAGYFIFAQAVFHANVAAQANAQTLWVLE